MRALSVNNILNKRYALLPFRGDWQEAFGEPEASGSWFIWAASGSGKTTFVLELVKYLASLGKLVDYNSLEEASAHTMQEAYRRVNMLEQSRRVRLLERASVVELRERLDKRKSADVVVIDSFQYAELSYQDYKRLKEDYPSKLFIIVSHADGRNPQGRTAVRVMFDASLKIWVEGYKAFSKGRYIGPLGHYTIWEDGANKYWGE